MIAGMISHFTLTIYNNKKQQTHTTADAINQQMLNGVVTLHMEQHNVSPHAWSTAEERRCRRNNNSNDDVKWWP